MIVEKTQDQTLINNNTKGFGIADEFQYEVMKMLTSKLYPNPIKAFIQEYISNAYDAMVKAGTLDSRFILVSLKPDASGQWYFIVQDEGSGMTEDIVDKYFMSLGASESRGQGDKIGAKGLGAKCAFAYTPVFQMRTRVDGKEYHYAFSMTETEMGGNLFKIEDTNAHNGTIVSIPVKSRDVYTVAKTLKQTIIYFRNVKLDVDWVGAGFSETFEPSRTITYQLQNKPIFKVTEQDVYSDMHLVLGQVHYPIDWNTLGLRTLWVPVALHIGLDEGIDVTPNRSEILYTESTKKKLVNKIQDVCKYMLKVYELDAKKEYDNFDDWFLSFKKEQWSSHVSYTFTDGEVSYPMSINDAVDYIGGTKHYPTMKGFMTDYPYKLLNMSRLLSGFQCIATINSNGKRKTQNFSATQVLHQNDLSDVLLLEDTWSRNKNAYLANQPVYEYNIVRKKRLTDEDIRKILSVREDDPKSAQYVADYKRFIEFLAAKLNKYDDVEVDPDWLEEYRSERKNRLQDGKTTITIYYGWRLYRETEKFDSLRTAGLLVYGQLNKVADESIIKFIDQNFGGNDYYFRAGKKRPQFMVIAKGNIKAIEAEANTINVWEWVKNQPKMVYTLATWVRNRQLMDEFREGNYSPLFRQGWDSYDGAFRKFPTYRVVHDLKEGIITSFSLDSLPSVLKLQVEDALSKGLYDHSTEWALKQLPSMETIEEIDDLMEAIKVGKNKLGNKIFCRHLIDNATYAGLTQKDAAFVRKIVANVWR